MEDLVVDDWHNEFNEICTRVCKHTSRLEMRNHVQAFMRGLASGARRKNSWHLAESAGFSGPDSLQRLMAQASLDGLVSPHDVVHVCLHFFGSGSPKANRSCRR